MNTIPCSINEIIVGPGGLRIIKKNLKFDEDSQSKSESINDDIDTQVY